MHFLLYMCSTWDNYTYAPWPATADYPSVDIYENHVYGVSGNKPLWFTISDVLIALIYNNDAVHHMGITTWMYVLLCILIEFEWYEYSVYVLTMEFMWPNLFIFFKF